MLKICCRQILDSLEQKLWNVQVIWIHFSRCCIFRCSFGCHSNGFTTKSQECWFALLRKSQCTIFKFNVLSTQISAKQLRLQGSVKWHRHLVQMAESVAVLVVSVVNETYVDWFSTGVRPHRLKHTHNAITIISICITCMHLSLQPSGHRRVG